MTSSKLSTTLAALSACLLLTIGCSSSKKQTTGALHTDSTAMKPQTHNWTLAFGSGGGITGMYMGYTINSNRTAYAWRGSQDTAQTTVTLDADVIDYITAQLDAMKFRSIKFNNPYNLTYFIELHEGDAVYAIRWGDVRLSPPEQVASLYGALAAFMRDRTGR